MAGNPIFFYYWGVFIAQSWSYENKTIALTIHSVDRWVTLHAFCKLRGFDLRSFTSLGCVLK